MSDELIHEYGYAILEDTYDIPALRQLAEDHAWREFNAEMAKTYADRVILDAAVGRWQRASWEHVMAYRIVAWTIPAADAARGRPGGVSSGRPHDRGRAARIRRGAAAAASADPLGEEGLADTA